MFTNIVFHEIHEAKLTEERRQGAIEFGLFPIYSYYFIELMKMVTKGQNFYSTSVMESFTYNDVLDGLIIKISPALVTITDGLIKTTPPEILQEIVQDHVIELLEHKVRTVHVDVNFEDYRGFAKKSPDINVTIFTPSFLESSQ